MSENSRYVTKASLRHITANDEASSLSGDFIIAHHSPALFRKGEDGRKKKREVLHLFRCYTHTHPARAGSTLKGKRKKKADTRRADGQKQRRGGKGNRRTSGTNLHGETDLTKTAHTPKPPRHITERHAGKIRDQMGD